MDINMHRACFETGYSESFDMLMFFISFSTRSISWLKSCVLPIGILLVCFIEKGFYVLSLILGQPMAILMYVHDWYLLTI
uniref:NADH dehydrogenase subunit 4 n=1 Tax=Ditylenchus dipsaci TaxID=166011 RepID=A0A915CVV0_9BILA